MKKIIFLIPSLNLGGAERITVNLANEFSKMNYEVFVVTLYSDGFFTNELSELVNHISLNIKRARNAILPLYKLIKSINPNFCISMTREISISCGIIFKLETNFWHGLNSRVDFCLKLANPSDFHHYETHFYYFV